MSSTHKHQTKRAKRDGSLTVTTLSPTCCTTPGNQTSSSSGTNTFIPASIILQGEQHPATLRPRAPEDATKEMCGESKVRFALS